MAGFELASASSRPDERAMGVDTVPAWIEDTCDGDSEYKPGGGKVSEAERRRWVSNRRRRQRGRMGERRVSSRCRCQRGRMKRRRGSSLRRGQRGQVGGRRVLNRRRRQRGRMGQRQVSSRWRPGVATSEGGRSCARAWVSQKRARGITHRGRASCE